VEKPVEINIKERPILFSGPMVRAILDGRKTQTRRVITHEARGADRVRWIDNGQVWPGRRGETYVGWVAEVDALGGESGLHLPLNCPYGKPGDRLWVRETFLDGLSDRSDAERASREDVYYRADGEAHEQFEDHMDAKWKPSIFMPRWASRITLDITNVRVERLQDISEEDALAEGVEAWSSSGNLATWKYQCLWDEINGKKHPWDSGPWVWVIEFKRIS
jgi:hypothetical protein